MKSKIILSLFFASTFLSWGQGWVSLFDGKSFAGWEGNYHYFRVENNAIVGGMTYADIPRNQFLSTADTYHDRYLRCSEIDCVECRHRSSRPQWRCFLLGSNGNYLPNLQMICHQKATPILAPTIRRSMQRTGSI